MGWFGLIAAGLARSHKDLGRWSGGKNGCYLWSITRSIVCCDGFGAYLDEDKYIIFIGVILDILCGFLCDSISQVGVDPFVHSKCC